MRPVRKRAPEPDPRLEHLAGLLATAISENRDTLEAAREARNLASEVHHLTVQQQISPDRLDEIAADVKAARIAAEAARQSSEMAFAGVQSLAALATAAEREKKAAAKKAEEAGPSAPEPAPAPAKPAARGKTGERP